MLIGIIVIIVGNTKKKIRKGNNMYADTTVKGKVVISLEKEDIKACKESLLSLVETIEQIYQNEFLVEEGVE